MKQVEKFFTTHLMHWHSTENKRIMPWKGEKNPYKIWLSEIILQQTRVSQGLSYYQKFIDAYPEIENLALAADAEVFKLWEGLGYYSRCKNLLNTARDIHHKLGGNFPETYEQILRLKGIGPYTASAIASFAYDLPHAVVDGNVYRVLSRFFGESVPIDSTIGKKTFKTLADKLLYQPDPASYNQAIMDFGAVVCKPRNPLCEECVLQPACVANKRGLVEDLPVKEKQLVKKNRWFNYFVFIVDEQIVVKRRTAKDIWQSLNEFYLYESTGLQKWTKKTVKKFMYEQLSISEHKLLSVSDPISQQLTHQNLVGQFIVIQLPAMPPTLSDYELIPVEDINKPAFPKLITTYLNSYGLPGLQVGSTVF
jgi:A/G-specific adenine glycosylase